MTKLDQNVAEEIAKLINSHIVWGRVLRDELDSGEADVDSITMAAHAEAKAAVELADRFGIELPCLDQHRKRVA